MPVAVKSLHLAENLEELKKKSAITSTKFKSTPIKNILISVQKLVAQAKELMKKIGEEKDEELTYLYLFRAMELWHIVMNSDEYKTDKKYYKMMYGKEITEIMDLLEKYTDILQKRYREKNCGSQKISDYSENLNQFKVQKPLSFKKRKEAGDTKNASSNGVENHSGPLLDQIIPGDFNLETVPNYNEPPPEDYYGEKKFIQCKELKELYLCSPEEVLILDTRPQKDFMLSQIEKAHCINLPEGLISHGLSANKLGGLITDPKQKAYWSRRDQYKQVVLMDWSSEEKDVIPNSTLDNLLIILLKWDPNVYYKNRPLVLIGGYEAWLDTYPRMSTNPNIERPQKKVVSHFSDLNKHEEIEYPMLEDETTPKPKPASVQLDHQNLFPKMLTSTPVIDRTTKPETLMEKFEKPETQSSPEILDKMVEEDYVAESENEYEAMDEDKDPTDSLEENRKVPSSDSEYLERSVAVNPEPSRPPVSSSSSHLPVNLPHSRPPVPSREDKKNYLAKTRKDLGDGDSSFSLASLKYDSTPSRAGGLKRSSSSPNINKLADEEAEVSKHLAPTYDRSNKPKPSPSLHESYGPRDRTADTIYSANSTGRGKGLTGLKNFGNICYMNSIMQCLSNTVLLNIALTRFNPKEISSRRQIASEVSSLIRNLWANDTKVTSCRNLKNRVGELRQSFAGYEQQDSHEFLTILLDWLHEDLNEPSIIRSLDGADEATGEKAWGEFKKKNNSIVLDLFYGQLKSTVTCQHCQEESVSFEPFSNLSVPLPPPKEPKELHSDDRCTIEECLRLYQKGETISGWICPSCKTARDATKKLDITRLPPVLIIHLKRFINEGWCRKRINMVDFPINDFDMRPFTHPKSELRFYNYDLYAVSNHLGSMHQGHYTAFCKNHEVGKWYKFNDHEFNDVSPNEVKSSAAYILFYESKPYEKHRVMD